MFISIFNLGKQVLLDDEECPLACAISNKKVPRFVLRENKSISSIKPEDTISQHSSSKLEKKKKLFGRSGEKAENNFKKTDDSINKKKKKRKTVPNFEVTQLENKDSFNSDEIIESVKSDKSDTSIDEIFDHWDKEDVVTENSMHSVSVNNIKNFKSSSEITSNTSSKKKDKEELIDNAVSLNDNNKYKSLSLSNSIIFYDQDNDVNNNQNPKRIHKRKKKSIQNSEITSKDDKNQSRSISKMFNTNKKKNYFQNSNTELSTNQLTPGILKVFGDNVSAGSNYKAVRVSTISSAKEVVQMALERYAFENADPKDFVLCDVVGTFQQPSSKSPSATKKQNKPKKGEDAENVQPIWNMEYIRVVNENEKPLILQSLWKPTGNRFRRFELRRKVDVDAVSFINTAEGLGRSSSESSLFESSETSSRSTGAASGVKEVSSVSLSPHPKSNNTSEVVRGEVVRDENYSAPLYVPYLLLIQGFRNASDKLLHKLDEPAITVGPFSRDGLKYHIELHSSDILQPHAYIYKKVSLDSSSDETNLDEINFDIFVDPAKDAEVSVNGETIKSTTMLSPGSILGFGKSYFFLFKDPTQQDTGLPWIKFLKPHNREPLNQTYATINVSRLPSSSTSHQGHISDEKDSSGNESSSESSSDEEDESSQYLAPRKHVEKSFLQLNYEIKEEDELLHMIINIADSDLGGLFFTYIYNII